MILRHARGFALIPVVLMLTLIGAMAYVIGMESGMTSRSMDRQFELRQAEYTAEAAYHHARWRLQHNYSCSGYTMLSSSLGGAPYTATVTPDHGTPVTVTATGIVGTDSMGMLQGSVTTFSETNTLVLQPGSEGIDSFIWDGAHDSTNFGAADILRVDSAGKEQAILIQFDLNALASGAIILSADLELYAYAGTQDQTGVIQAHPLTRAWVEGTRDDSVPLPGEGVTYVSPDGGSSWNNLGGDYDPVAAAATAISDGISGWKTWEVTEPVRAWTAGSRANYGFILRVSSGDLNRREFASSDAADATLHPKLTVEYGCACGTPCIATLTPADSLVLSTENPASLGGVAFEQTDLVEYNPGTHLASIRLQGRPIGLTQQIDALHIFGDGTYLLSTRADAVLGGLSFSDADLILYDAPSDTATMYFKSRLHFSDPSTQIDGVMVLPSENLILSVQADSQIAGLTVRQNDLVEYDPRSQTASLVLEGDAIGLREPPVALHALSNGHLVLAFQNPTTFGGGSFLPGDLVEYDPVSDKATEYMSGLEAFQNDENRVQSLSILDGYGPSTPRDPRLVAHWKLDETSGVIAQDSAGDHDGTLEGPDWAPGQIDGAAEFNGSNDLIKVAHADTLSLQKEFTISAWTRLDDPVLSDSYRILSKEATGRNDNYFMAFQGNALYVGVEGEFFSPPNTFLPEVWYHVAASFDSEANAIRIYVDGVESYSGTTYAELSPNTDPLMIGSNWQGSKPFYGALDDIRIYNYALAPNEIETVMKGSTTSGTTGGEIGGTGEEAGGSAEGFSGTYRDEFNAFDTYAGSDGSLEWTTPWVEINESDGPERGDEILSDDNEKYQLRLSDNDGGGEGVYRAVNLSKCAQSSFSFQYRRGGLDRASDYVSVSASKDGGKNWTQLQLIEGPGTDDTLILSRHDLSDFLTADVQVRFLTSPTLGKLDYLYIDDVEISCE